MHTYTHTHIHTNIHTYIHTYIHTHIHTFFLWQTQRPSLMSERPITCTSTLSSCTPATCRAGWGQSRVVHRPASLHTACRLVEAAVAGGVHGSSCELQHGGRSRGTEEMIPKRRIYGCCVQSSPCHLLGFGLVEPSGQSKLPSGVPLGLRPRARLETGPCDPGGQ